MHCWSYHDAHAAPWRFAASDGGLWPTLRTLSDARTSCRRYYPSAQRRDRLSKRIWL